MPRMSKKLKKELAFFLNDRWATGEKYGEKILSILKAIVEEGKVQFMESITLSVPYMVRVTIPDLNIRKGPGTSFQKTGKFTGVGIFAIVEESDGWGCSKPIRKRGMVGFRWHSPLGYR